MFELVENSGVDFNNKVVDGQLENSFFFRNFYNGGGVAVGDLNNDGLADIFFTSNMGDNKLYLNKGNFKFEDITKTVRYCAGQYVEHRSCICRYQSRWLAGYLCLQFRPYDHRAIVKISSISITMI